MGATLLATGSPFMARWAVRAVKALWQAAAGPVLPVSILLQCHSPCTIARAGSTLRQSKPLPSPRCGQPR